jgi:hypothetical protein
MNAGAGAGESANTKPAPPIGFTAADQRQKDAATGRFFCPDSGHFDPRRGGTGGLARGLIIGSDVTVVTARHEFLDASGKPRRGCVFSTDLHPNDWRSLVPGSFRIGRGGGDYAVVKLIGSIPDAHAYSVNLIGYPFKKCLNSDDNCQKLVFSSKGTTQESPILAVEPDQGQGDDSIYYYNALYTQTVTYAGDSGSAVFLMEKNSVARDQNNVAAPVAILIGGHNDRSLDSLPFDIHNPGSFTAWIAIDSTLTNDIFIVAGAANVKITNALQQDPK